MAVISRGAVDEAQPQGAPVVSGATPVGWTRSYVRGLLGIDVSAAAVAGLLAVEVRFGGAVTTQLTFPYLLSSLALPLLWWAAVALAGGYARRFIGVGTEEYRRVLGAGVALVAAVAVAAYATKTDVARGYVLIALPSMTVMCLLMRYAWRKRLHRRRAAGECMRRVIAVGHRDGVRDLIRQFRGEPYHGMHVMGVCLPPVQCDPRVTDVDGRPVLGDFSSVADVVAVSGADTVAVLT